jgi:transcriptional regulator with XRE-family HTH domain
MEINKKIKLLRKDLGLSQTEFGKIVGLSQNVISDIERGRANPSKTLVAYLKYRYGYIFSDLKDIEEAREIAASGKQRYCLESTLFQQKELARDVNYELLKLERLHPDALIEVKDFIKFKIAMYDRRQGERRQHEATDFDPGEERRSGQERRKAVGS